MPESEASFKAIPPSEMKGRRIGRIFVKMQLVKREQVSKALAVQKERAESGQKVKVGEVLRELGLVTDQHIAYALAGQAGMQLVDLDPDAIPAEAVDALPAETATSYQIAPVSFDAGSNRLVVALKSPDNFQAIDNLRLLLNFDAVAVIADPEAIVPATLILGAKSFLLLKVAATQWILRIWLRPPEVAQLFVSSTWF